ncbi:MAG: helix-turn-helix transcriptional regulator [Bacteroidota bacterium]
MGKNAIGEFEELVLLTVLILQEEAYILKIKEELVNQANRKSAMGALHITLSRLEKKDLLTSSLGGATTERGGRRKRIYELTAAGKAALNEVKETRNNMWNNVPKLALKFAYAK